MHKQELSLFLVPLFQADSNDNYDKLINSINKPFKILGDGELKNALVVRGTHVSKQARAKIEKAGGTVEEIKAEKPVKGVKLGPRKAKKADSPETEK